MATKKYTNVMLIDDNEIDNLINQKMIEAAVVAENIYTHTSAKSAKESLRKVDLRTSHRSTRSSSRSRRYGRVISGRCCGGDSGHGGHGLRDRHRVGDLPGRRVVALPRDDSHHDEDEDHQRHHHEKR